MDSTPRTDKWYQDKRVGGLRRFAIAITGLNILGHFYLGFEQSWAQPLVALATAYVLETLLEVIDARSKGRPTRFAGGRVAAVDFLLSAHITGLAVSMLLYANETLLPIAFAVSVAICSKSVFRATVGGSSRHFLNPSNVGISATLLVFPWIGIAPPYHFTENTSGALDWALPVLIILSGSFLNARFTNKLPLIAAWVGCFVAQGVVRSLLFGTPVEASMVPMTGMAFVLFTFYMVTDPATTPSGTRAQVAFGAAVAVAYGMLVGTHVVFGLFFALTIVCAFRGLWLWADASVLQRARVNEALSTVVAREA